VDTATAADVLATDDDQGGSVFVIPHPPAHDLARGPRAGQRRRVRQVGPAGATADGNITVLVLGEGFADFGDPKCRFGPAEVAAKVHHAGAMTCVAPPLIALSHFHIPVGRHKLQQQAETYDSDAFPPRPLPAHCDVEVSFNGVDFTRSSLASFAYFNASRVELFAISPTGGPALGGTEVTVTGSHFVDYGGGGVRGPQCQFGAPSASPVVPATLISSRKLVCVSPARVAAAPANPALFVTLNGYADWRGLLGRAAAEAGADTTFRYAAEPPQPTAAFPWGGPAAGGSLVTVSGSGFEDDGEPQCFFSLAGGVGFGAFELVSAATVAQDGLSMRCEAPPLRAPSRADVGGTGGFYPTGVVGSVGGAGGDGGTWGAAPLRGSWGVGWCADQHAVCRTASYHDEGAGGAVVAKLHVTLNGNRQQASAGAVPWLYHPTRLPVVEYTSPWGAPIGGGTTVRVVGSGLLSYGGVLCRFAQPDGAAPLDVAADLLAADADEVASEHSTAAGAAFVTRTVVFQERDVQVVDTQPAALLRCDAPPAALANRSALGDDNHASLVASTLSVSLDAGQHWTPHVSFWYADVAVSALDPSGGPAAGGTLITVRGRGFGRFGGAICHFDQHNNATVSVNATVDDLHSLRCVSPPLTAGPSAAAVAANVSVDIFGGAGPITSALPFGVAAGGVYANTSTASPTTGPAAGGTLVALAGDAIAHTSSLSPRCRFGEAEPSRALLRYTIDLSGEQALEALLCVAPPAASGATGAVPLQLALNGEQFAGDVVFTYTDVCVGLGCA